MFQNIRHGKVKKDEIDGKFEQETAKKLGAT